MADILGHGPDREPSRWTSPLALAVAGLVLVAFVLLVRGMADRPAARRPAAESGTKAASPQGRGSPQSRGDTVPFGVTVSRATRSKEPTRFSGEVTRSVVDRLLLTGSRPGWLQVATGRFKPISGLPPWAAGYGFTRVAGGWAFQRYSPPQANCQVCDTPPAVYFVPANSARATVVGAAYDDAAAASAGDLWLMTYLPGADISASSGTAQEVTVAGRDVGSPSQLPRGYVIDRAVRGGLLLSAYVQRPGLVRDYLWDPVAGQVVRRFTNVIAASSGQVAWDRCLGQCPLKILMLPGGAVRSVRFAHGGWAIAGTFSSDGRLLAVQVTTHIRRDGSAAATRLEVVNTATGQLTVVPGSTVSFLIGVTFGWQPGSDRLLAALALPSGTVELASWRPGAAHMSLQAVHLPAGTSPVLGDQG